VRHVDEASSLRLVSVLLGISLGSTSFGSDHPRRIHFGAKLQTPGLPPSFRPSPSALVYQFRNISRIRCFPRALSPRDGGSGPSGETYHCHRYDSLVNRCGPSSAESCCLLVSPPKPSVATLTSPCVTPHRKLAVSSHPGASSKAANDHVGSVAGPPNGSSATRRMPQRRMTLRFAFLSRNPLRTTKGPRRPVPGDHLAGS
jgi:hypothetical protein